MCGYRSTVNHFILASINLGEIAAKDAGAMAGSLIADAGLQKDRVRTYALTRLLANNACVQRMHLAPCLWTMPAKWKKEGFLFYTFLVTQLL